MLDLQKNNKKNSLMPNDIENNFKTKNKKRNRLSSQTYSDLTKLSKKYAVKLKLLNE